MSSSARDSQSPPITMRPALSSHEDLVPSPWVQRWSTMVSPGQSVLDVACGKGRHVRWFHERGAAVTGVDIDAVATKPLVGMAEIVIADLENGPWPFAGREFDAVVVTNYLWRPLVPQLLQSLAPGGLLIYETFGQLQPQFGRPKNPAFLLERMELIEFTRSLKVLAYEDLMLDDPPRHVQRVAALRDAAAR
jgi:SAM-dependent methyltransferase